VRSRRGRWSGNGPWFLDQLGLLVAADRLGQSDVVADADGSDRVPLAHRRISTSRSATQHQKSGLDRGGSRLQPRLDLSTCLDVDQARAAFPLVTAAEEMRLDLVKAGTQPAFCRVRHPDLPVSVPRCLSTFAHVPEEGAKSAASEPELRLRLVRAIRNRTAKRRLPLSEQRRIRDSNS